MPVLVLLVASGLFVFLFGFIEKGAVACDQGLYLRSDWLSDRPKAERILSPASYKDLYIHLNRLGTSGLNASKIQKSLKTIREAFPNARIQGWLGLSVCAGKGEGTKTTQKKVNCANLENAAARKKILNQVKAVWQAGFDGVHLDLEPIPSGDSSLTTLLKEVRAAQAPGKMISLAGMSLTIRGEISAKLHPKPKGNAIVFSWNESDYQNLLPWVDQVMVMNYDTALRSKDEYILFTQYQTQALSQVFENAKDSVGRQVELKIGIPVYQHGRPGVFDPKIENLSTALEGIGRVWKGKCPHRGGIAIFIEDEFNSVDQKTFNDWSKDL